MTRASARTLRVARLAQRLVGSRGTLCRSRALRALLVAALALALFTPSTLMPGPAMAATITWDRAAGSCPAGSNWSLTACYDLGRAPTTGDAVVLAPPANNCPRNYDLGGVQLLSITENGDCGGATTYTGGPIALQSGGSITVNTNSVWTTTFPGITLNGPATFSLTDASHWLAFGGAITGTGPLTLSNTAGSDQLTLDTANSYTGATTVNGTARIASSVNGAIPTGSALTVSAGARMGFNNQASTIGSLAGAGQVTVNNVVLTAGGDDTSTTFSGVIGGLGGFTKAGTGTLTLSGANTYSGATTVNGGTLRMTGSLTNTPVTVASGATLEGSGTISSSVTLAGTVAPGSSGSAGQLNANGNVTFNNGSDLTLAINGTTAGTQYSRLRGGGAVTINAGATLTPTLGYAPTAGASFTVLQAVGGLTGTFANAANGSTLTASFGGRSYNLTVSYTANNVVLTVQAAATATPPSTATPAPSAAPPTISAVSDQTTSPGVPVTVRFTVEDEVYPANELMLGWGAGSPSLIRSVTFGGSGTSRSATILPVADTMGNTAVYLTAVNPGGGSASRTFRLNIAPATPTPTAVASPTPVPGLVPAGVPTVAVAPLTTLPPGITPPTGGGTIVSVPAGPPGAVGVISTGAVGGAAPVSVAVPTGGGGGGNGGSRAVGVRLQPTDVLPGGATVPAGRVLTLAVQIDVFDLVTGQIIHHHDPPLTVAFVVPDSARANCAAHSERIVLMHVDDQGLITRLPPSSLDCTTGVLVARLYDTSVVAVAETPSGLTIPFRLLMGLLGRNG